MFNKSELKFLLDELVGAWRYHQSGIDALKVEPFLDFAQQQKVVDDIEATQCKNEEMQEKIQALIDNTQ